MSAATPLYRRLIGENYYQLPSLVQDMHDVEETVVAIGVANVERANTKLGQFVGDLLGMPPAGKDLPAIVTFTLKEGSEILRREYGDAILETVQREGRGKDAGHLIEQFGPVCLIIKLLGNIEGIQFQIVRVRLFGFPLMKRAWPSLEAREWAEEGWYRFYVAIGLPVVGRIIKYVGRLKIEK